MANPALGVDVRREGQRLVLDVTAQSWTAKQARVALQVRSLYDSFA